MVMDALFSIPPQQVAMMSPSWICLDLETADADDAAIDAALAQWKPPGNVKTEASIEKRRVEAAEKIREKAALLDASPIICGAFQTATNKVLFSAGFGSIEVPGWLVIDSSDERLMLKTIRAWLDGLTSVDTLLVGQNIRGFDLPKLRQAFIRHRLRLPTILQPESNVDVYDTMQRIKSYSMELRDERYISLERICAVLDIETPKQLISGAQIPQMAKAGEFQAIGIYCAIDCAATARAYQLMTSTAPDME